MRAFAVRSFGEAPAIMTYRCPPRTARSSYA